MGILQGYKTYIVSGLAIAAAIGGYLDGDMTLQNAIAAVFGAIGAMTLRHGITTEGGK